MSEIIKVTETVTIEGVELKEGDKFIIVEDIRNKNKEEKESLQEMTSTITDKLNNQYNEELKSALIYKQLEIIAKYAGYTGLSHYFHEASEEEYEHAEDFKKIIEDLEGLPIINFTIESSPAINFDFVGLIRYALDHEKFITASIRELVETAKSNNDEAVKKFLAKYLEEQIDEEAKYNEILTRIQAVGVGENSTNILLIDQELLKSED